MCVCVCVCGLTSAVLVTVGLLGWGSELTPLHRTPSTSQEGGLGRERWRGSSAGECHMWGEGEGLLLYWSCLGGNKGGGVLLGGVVLREAAGVWGGSGRCI